MTWLRWHLTVTILPCGKTGRIGSTAGNIFIRLVLKITEMLAADILGERQEVRLSF